ncbi:MAG: STM4014 family protein [Pirellulales bacterium]|nr:STM4014 family protein [Pirellulales bacterium]
MKLFQTALNGRGSGAACVVSYFDVLQGSVSLFESLAQNEEDSTQGTILRIESPGEDHLVERALIARGATGTSEISQASALRMRADHGRVRFVGQWFAGYSLLLADIESTLSILPNVSVQNHPAAIQLLFDKPRCQAFLAENGVATPPTLPTINDYQHLLEVMRQADCSRVFAKLANGSSASGVVALNTNGARPVAITTLEIVRRCGEPRFYNNLKLSRYDRERDLRDLFEFLCRQGVHVERWLPKAAQAGRNFDLRVVTYCGKACHAVVRTSRSPMTNLHLGNRRGDLEELKNALGKRWEMITALCEQAAAAFPNAQYVGWDVLVTPGFRSAYILEGNAFGDLLPGITYGGVTSYEFAIQTAEYHRIRTG